jgi:hypothetical protein
VTLTKPALLRGMKVPAEQAHSFEQIADTINLVMRHNPDLPCAMIGNDALYLCFTANLSNPVPYYVAWPGLAREEDKAQRWAGITRTRPLLILQKIPWDPVNDFYRRSHYIPLLYVPAEDLEIAVPRELADSMGVSIYGLFGLGRPKVRL